MIDKLHQGHETDFLDNVYTSVEIDFMYSAIPKYFLSESYQPEKNTSI